MLSSPGRPVPSAVPITSGHSQRTAWAEAGTRAVPRTPVGERRAERPRLRAPAASPGPGAGGGVEDHREGTWGWGAVLAKTTRPGFPDSRWRQAAASDGPRGTREWGTGTPADLAGQVLTKTGRGRDREGRGKLWPSCGRAQAGPVWSRRESSSPHTRNTGDEGGGRCVRAAQPARISPVSGRCPPKLCTNPNPSA